MSVARIYARTQNETASKERLMVLLFEAALRHMRTAGPALAAKQYRRGQHRPEQGLEHRHRAAGHAGPDQGPRAV